MSQVNAGSAIPLLQITAGGVQQNVEMRVSYETKKRNRRLL